MTDVSADPRIVRARRYVSAPPGVYPPPVRAVPGSGRGPAPERDDRPAPPAVPEPRVLSPAPLLEEAAVARTEREAPAAAPARPPGWGGLLLGAAVGSVIGASLGMILVAFFGGCEPSLAWTDPFAVWRAVTDPVIRFSGILVAAGCALLGAALGGRRTPPPPED